MKSIFLDEDVDNNVIYYNHIDSDIRRIYKLICSLRKRKFNKAPVQSQKTLESLIFELNRIKVVPLSRSYVIEFEKINRGKKDGILYKMVFRPENIRIYGETYENPIAPVKTNNRKVCENLGVFYADIDGNEKRTENDIISVINREQSELKAYIY